MLAVCATSGLGCELVEPRASGERALLARRVETLRRVVAASDQGSLLRPHQVLVVVNQSLLTAIIGAHLPWEETVVDRFRVRVSAVDVECEDGLALLRMDASVRASDDPEGPVLAELRLFGEVALVEADAESGTLKGQVTLLAFEARPLHLPGATPAAKKLARELGRLQLGAFAALARPFEMPVRLEPEVEIPAGDARAPLAWSAGRLKMTITVADALAYDGRLWIALKAGVERYPRAAAALGPARGEQRDGPQR